MPADLVFPGEAGVAKLHFALPTPSSRDEWSAQHAAIAALPCTQAVLSPLVLASGIDLGDHGLQQIEHLARSLPDDVWERTMRTWRHCRWHGEPSACANPRFRASCLRDGKHSFNAPAVGECVGAAIFLSRGIPVHLWDYELELVCIVLQRQVLLAVNLWHGNRKFFKARMGPEPRPLMPYADTPARLRASTAWLMMQLADVQPGDVVLDPMCGIGTLPVIAAATSPCAVALGGDIDDELLSQAARNASWLHEVRQRMAATTDEVRCHFLPLQCGASDAPMQAWHASERLYSARTANSGVLPIAWDATALALRTACVDVIAVDLPFGVVHKVKGGKNGLTALYSKSIREMARVLRPGGRLVALSTSRRIVEEALKKPVGMWERVAALQINNGGALTWVVTAVRTSAPPSLPPARRPFAALPTRLATPPAGSAHSASTPIAAAAVAAQPLERKGRNTARALRRAQKRAERRAGLWPFEFERRQAAAFAITLAVGLAVLGAHVARRRGRD